MPSLQHVYDDWVVLPACRSPGNVSRHCGSEQQHLQANTKLVELHCSVTISVVAGTVLAVDAKISLTLWLRRAESVQASGLLLQRIFLQDQHWHSWPVGLHCRQKDFRKGALSRMQA